MSNVVTSTTGWGSRLGGAFKGIITGLILAGIAFVLLFWNEKRTVETYRGLKEMESVTVEGDSAKVDAANEGKCVHMTGSAKTDEILTDPIFGVETNAFHLSRNVEMYQWVEHVKTETKKNVGGSETTTKTYSYTTEWSSTLNDSSAFNNQSHVNPSSMPYESATFDAQTAAFGAFRLSETQIGKVDKYEPFAVKAPEVPAVVAPETPATPEVPVTPEVPAVEEPAASTAMAEVATEATEAPAKTYDVVLSAVGESKIATIKVLQDSLKIEQKSAMKLVTGTLPAAIATGLSEDAALELVLALDEAGAKAEIVETVEPQAVANPVVAPVATVTTVTADDGRKYVNDGIYFGADPAKPAVGDVRVSFKFVPSPQDISIAAVQTGDTFTNYVAKNGKTFNLLNFGTSSSAEMFAGAQSANKMMGWILRFVGFFLMFLGFSMILTPLSVLADVLPILGNIVGVGTKIIAFLLALVLSLLTIGIAWLFYRPLIGIPLVVVSLGLLIYTKVILKKKTA